MWDNTLFGSKEMNMRRATCRLLAVMLYVCVSAAAPAQELVTNGGFESWDGNGIAQPWVYDGIGIGLTDAPVFLGIRSMGFFRVDAPATLTQSGLATMLDHEYLVGFRLYRDEWATGGTQSFKVTFDGTELDAGSGPPEDTWTYYSFYAHGTGNANASLVFEGLYEKGSWFLDDVSVEVVPEPALMQLPVLLGLAGLGYWRRRRSA